MNSKNRNKFEEIMNDLGFGRAIGETYPDGFTIGQAIAELDNAIEIARADGEPLNLEVFGDEFDEPIDSTRRAYFAAVRMAKKLRTMSKAGTL